MIYFVCKYNEEDCSSRVEMTDVIKYAAVCRITGLASFHPQELTLPSLTCEVRTTEDASLKFVYLVLRNAAQTYRYVTRLFVQSSLYLDRHGNADSNRSGGKKFLGHIVPGNFGGKAAFVSQN